MKTQLQKEGFDPSTINDPLYFLDPDRGIYVELTPEIYAEIVKHTIKF